MTNRRCVYMTLTTYMTIRCISSNNMTNNHYQKVHGCDWIHDFVLASWLIAAASRQRKLQVEHLLLQCVAALARESQSMRLGRLVAVKCFPAAWQCVDLLIDG